MKMYVISEDRLKTLVAKEPGGDVDMLMAHYDVIDKMDLRYAMEWKIMKAMFPRECAELVGKYREKIRQAMG